MLKPGSSFKVNILLFKPGKLYARHSFTFVPPELLEHMWGLWIVKKQSPGWLSKCVRVLLQSMRRERWREMRRATIKERREGRWRGKKKKGKEGLTEGKRMEGRAGTAVRRYFLCSAFPPRAPRPALYVPRLWAGTDRKRRGWYIREEADGFASIELKTGAKKTPKKLKRQKGD